MNKVRRTLIALVLTAVSASAPIAINAAPFPHFFHLHPQPAVAQVTRYTFTIFNNTYAFQQFKINGITHTVPSHYNLVVKAPAGTRIYAASKIGDNPRGSLLFTVTPQYDAQQFIVE
ncbi:MAG TPA: hypothetical protein VFE38_13230 [Edaphobacter sp.]|nr:hypothetical protein [Edaphobacter sp.]